MNNKLIYGLCATSIFLNIVVLSILMFDRCSGDNPTTPKRAVEAKQKIEEKAKEKIKEYICSNLYLPESFDPVETRVDSAYHYFMTDYNCVKAGEELIKDRRAYENAKREYDEAVNNIRTFGGSGVFRHYTVERDDCQKTMEEKKANIEKNEQIIKNRNTSHDGEFIGWFVYNRYRAKTNNNTVVFGETLLLFDKDLEQWQISYNIEKDKDANFEEVRKVIEDVLDNN